ncbi:MAG: hypothetical protein HY053_03260 [Proteobacteria bacterium]|nr:hypothetical protein [Pseudomonadota bacterium]
MHTPQSEPQSRAGSLNWAACSLFLKRGMPLLSRALPDGRHDSRQETVAAYLLSRFARATPSMDTRLVNALAGGEAACRYFRANGNKATVVGWFRPKDCAPIAVAVTSKGNRAFWWHTDTAPESRSDIPFGQRGQIYEIGHKQAAWNPHAERTAAILRSVFFPSAKITTPH